MIILRDTITNHLCYNPRNKRNRPQRDSVWAVDQAGWLRVIKIFYHTITSRPVKRMADLLLFGQQADFEETVNLAFEAVDAEITKQAFLARDKLLIVSRQELNASNLIGFRVLDENGWTLLGECGWIFVQYISVSQTHISFKAVQPSLEDIEKYFSRNSMFLLDNLFELSVEQIRALQHTKAFEKLIAGRREMLRSFYAPISARLVGQAQSLVKASQPEPESHPISGGRPGLANDELIRRLALVLLERRLKQKDPGLTRGEFVVQAQQKLKIPLESHTIKNAAKLLTRVQKNEEQTVLAMAEEMAANWQKKFE